MPDKRVQFGRKAPTHAQQPPDPNEFIHGPRTSEDSPSTGASGQDDNTKTPPEPLVRITVDVPKSVHKQLQTICQASETKLAPYIRELIAKDLKKRRNVQ